MKPRFQQIIDKLKSASDSKIPRVKFSSEIRGKMPDIQDLLDYIEGMMTLLEVHPFLPLNSKCSFGSDVLDLRRALAYEIIIRQLGHVRSLVANANAFNHIGTGVAIRCMLELYAFVVFLHETDTKEDEKLLYRLLHGRLFTSGDWYDIEKAWEEMHGEPAPNEFKDFLKTLLKTPHASTYLKRVKGKDKGFAYMYAVYSDFVHPTFERPRNQFLEDIERKDVFYVLEAQDYFLMARKQPSPLNTIKRDIDSGGFCLELFWPKALSLDPLFDNKLRTNIVKALISQGVFTKEEMKDWAEAGMIPEDILE